MISYYSGTKKPWIKCLSCLVAFLFTFHQLSWAQGNPPVPYKEQDPRIQTTHQAVGGLPVGALVTSPVSTVQNETISAASASSIDFLQGTSPLRAAEETFFHEAPLSYTANLKSSDVTTLPGSPYPYITPGSSAPTSLSYNSSAKQFGLTYNVTAAGSQSGFTISFDNESTPGVETQNLSALANLIFGLKGPNTSIALEITDINQVKDTFTLTNISKTSERFWRVPVADISNSLDKTKIKSLHFIVTQANTTAATRTGTVTIRTKGLNVNVPAPPTVDPEVSLFTNQSSITLSGTREANTAILINNVVVVPIGNSTAWTAAVNLNLTKDGSKRLDIKARNSIGKVSTVKSVTVVKDTSRPTGSMTMIPNTAHTSNPVVTLNLTKNDSGSGVDRMSFSNDGVNWSALESFAAAKSYTLPAGDGNKTVYVKFYDKAGNASDVYSQSIILDTLPPTAVLISPVSVTDAAYTLTYEITDNYDLPRTVSESLTLSAGENIITRTFTDQVGNAADVSFVVTLEAFTDTVPPEIIFTSAAASDNSVYTLTYTVDGVPFSETRILSQAGDNILKVTKIDAAFNTSVASLAVHLTLPDETGTDQFSVTTDHGDHLKFSGSEVAEVALSDNTLVNDLQLNQDGSLASALARFGDGSLQILEDGKVLLYRRPDGSHVYFNQGKIEKVITAEGVSIFYSYLQDAAGNLSEVVLDSDLFRAFYDAQGKLKQHENKKTGLKTHFSAGILANVTARDSRKVIYQSQTLGADILVTPAQYVMAQGQTQPFTSTPVQLALIEYLSLKYEAASSVLKEARDKTGRTFFFEKGLLSKILDVDGKTIELSSQESSLSNITHLNIAEGNVLSVYDAEGLLASVSIAAGSSESRDQIFFNKQGVIDHIEKADGSVLSHLSFDAQGHIDNAQALTPNQSLRFYEAKQLVKEIKEDGTLTTFISGTPEKTTLPDGRVYIYTKETAPDGKARTKSSLIRYQSEDKNTVTLENGIPVRIETPSGMTLTQLHFGVTGLLLDAEISTASANGENWTGLYRNGEIQEITFPDGRKLFYEKGILKKISMAGQETNYEYRYGENGEISSFTVTDSSGKKSFNAQGNLLQYQTEDYTADFQGGILKKLSYASIVIEDPILSADGKITGGTLRGFDDQVYTFKDSQLTALRRANGTTLFYDGDLVSQVQTASKTVKYFYTKDEAGKILNVEVEVNGAPRQPFYQYYVDPANVEEKPVTPDSYNLATHPVSFLRLYMNGAFGIAAGASTFRVTNPQDGEAQFVFDSSKFVSTKGERLYIQLDLYNSQTNQMPKLGDDGFAYFRFKQESLSETLSVRPEWVPLAGIARNVFSEPLQITHSYQDFFTLTRASSSAANIFQARLNFEPPLQETEVFKFSIAEAAYFRISRAVSENYKKHLILPSSKILEINALPLTESLTFLRSEKLFDHFNHHTAAEDFAITLTYDENFTLTQGTRADGSVIEYADGKALSAASEDGTKAEYVYENGELKEVRTQSPDPSRPGTIAYYQYGRIRTVTDTAGKLIYTYTYEITDDQKVITFITDAASGEVKRYEEGKLISSETPDKVITRYFYEGDRIESSRVYWQERLLHSFQYAYEGEKTLITDEKGDTRVYDPNHKLIFLKTAKGLGYQYDYLHDEENNPIEQQQLYSADAGNGTTLFYKEDTVEKITLKDGTVLNIADNDPDLYQKVLIKQGLVDQVIHKTGEVATYIRDDRGRLTEVRVEKNGIFSTYTPEGRLKSRVEANGDTYHYGYLYDAQGNIDKVRVVKRVPTKINGTLPPLDQSGHFLRLAALSGGYTDGWNATLLVNDEGVGKFNYNYWENGNNWQGRGYDIAVVDINGQVVKKDFFDVWGKQYSESERMADFLESVAEGQYVVMAVADEGYWNLSERAKLAIESFGSSKIRQIRFRDSWTLIGQKGAPPGTAIEQLKEAGEGLATIQNFTTEYAYYDKSGTPIAYDAFTSIPDQMWYSNVQTYVGDSAEILATSHLGNAAAYRKNFNELYPESGFIHLWETSANFSTDAYVADVTDMLQHIQRKAVYYDERYPSNYMPAFHALTIKDKLAAKGFEVVDADGLAQFLKANGPNSAVVMAHDVIPDTVYDPFSAFSISKREIPQDYLKAGGTIVWTHDQPFFYVGRKGGQKDYVGEMGPKRVLGVSPLFRLAYRYQDSTETFDQLPSDWGFSPPESVTVQDGKLVLSENSRAIPFSYFSSVRAPRFSATFSNSTLDSGLLIGMEGNTWNGDYNRVAVRQTNGIFQIEQIEYGREKVVATAPYVHGTDYTVEVRHTHGSVELYLYPKNSARPENPVFMSRSIGWSSVRFHSSISTGQASIEEVKTSVLKSAPEPIGASTRLPSFAVPPGAASLNLSDLYFDTNVNFRTLRWDKIAESIGFTLDSDTTVVAAYDQKGDVISLTKADRSVTVYEDGKEQFVTDINGYMLVEYFYDGEGNLIRITNHAARRDLANAALDSKEKAHREKSFALADFGQQRQMLTDTFLAQVNEQRSVLQSAKSNLENQLRSLEGQKARGKKNKKAKSHALDDIRGAINNVTQAQINFEAEVSREMAEFNAELDAQEQSLKRDIDIAFAKIDEEFAGHEKNIRLSEARPVITHYYREVLGRDPSASELSALDQEAMSLAGINAAALSSTLHNSEEFIERNTRSGRIRGEIEDSLNEYLNADASGRENILTSLGLSSSSAVSLTSSDVQKIMGYLNQQGLHFGESAIDSLMALLASKGFSPSRDQIAKELILVDIFSGILHPYLEGELLISLYAMKKIAVLHGLEAAEALKLSYADLQALYLANPSSRMILHVSGSHYLIVKEVRENEIVLLDTTKGAAGEESVLSKEEFLKTWQGITLSADAGSLVQDASKTLTVQESMNIRGAFFWIIPAIFAAIGSLISAIGAIIAAIGALIVQVATVIANVLVGLAQIVGNLVHGIGALVKAAYTGIKYVGIQLFKGFTSFFASTTSKGIFASFKATVGKFIYKTVISTGLKYLVQKGLDLIGVDPGISNIVSAFITGGIQGGFTSAGFDFASFLSSGLKAGLYAGSKTVLEAANLDIALSGILSLASGSLIEGFWSGNIAGELVKIAPKLIKDLSVYGIQKLGESLGLSSDLVSLFGMPIASSVADLVANLVNPNGGGGPGPSLFDRLQDLIKEELTLGAQYLLKKLDLPGDLAGVLEITASAILQATFDQDQKTNFGTALSQNADKILSELLLYGIERVGQVLKLDSSLISLAMAVGASLSDAILKNKALNPDEIWKHLEEFIQKSAAKLIEDSNLPAPLKNFLTNLAQKLSQAASDDDPATTLISVLQSQASEFLKTLGEYGVTKLASSLGLESLLGANAADVLKEFLNAILEGRPLDSVVWNGLEKFVLQGVSRITTQLGLPAGLSGLIGATVSEIISTLSDQDPNTTPLAVLGAKLPELVKQFALSGVTGLAESLGFDPELSALAKKSMENILNAVLTGSAINGEILNALSDLFTYAKGKLGETLEGAIANLAERLGFSQELKDLLLLISSEITGGSNILSVFQNHASALARAFAKYGVQEVISSLGLKGSFVTSIQQALENFINGRPLGQILWDELQKFILSSVTKLSAELHLPTELAGVLGATVAAVTEALKQNKAGDIPKILDQKLPEIIKEFSVYGALQLGTVLGLDSSRAQAAVKEGITALLEGKTLGNVFWGHFGDFIEAVQEKISDEIELPEALKNIVRSIAGAIQAAELDDDPNTNAQTVFLMQGALLLEELTTYGSYRLAGLLGLNADLTQRAAQIFTAVLKGESITPILYDQFRDFVVYGADQLQRYINENEWISFAFGDLEDESFQPEQIQKIIGLSAGKEDLFDAVFDAVREGLLVPLESSPEKAASEASGIQAFHLNLLDPDVAAKLESRIGAIFDARAMEAIYTAGWETILARARTSVTLPDGQAAEELRITDSFSLYFNAAGDLIARKTSGRVEVGSFGSREDRFGLINGKMFLPLFESYGLRASVEQGQLKKLSVKSPDQVLVELEGIDQGFISLTRGNILKNAVLIFKNNVRVIFYKGLVTDIAQKIAELVKNTFFPEQSAQRGERSYFLNGIGNQGCDKPGYAKDVPCYAEDLRAALNRADASNKFGFRDINFVPLFNGTTTVAGAVEWLQQFKLSATENETILIDRLKKDKQAGLIQEWDVINIIGYSGGAQVLLDALNKEDLHVRVNLIAVGAPMFELGLSSSLESFLDLYGSKDFLARGLKALFVQANFYGLQMLQRGKKFLKKMLEGYEHTGPRGYFSSGIYPFAGGTMTYIDYLTRNILSFF